MGAEFAPTSGTGIWDREPMQPNIAIAVGRIILGDGINAYLDHPARFVGGIEDCAY
jgi:hypothetical protein